jgi:hypothetical protein
MLTYSHTEVNIFTCAYIPVLFVQFENSFFYGRETGAVAIQHAKYKLYATAEKLSSPVFVSVSETIINLSRQHPKKDNEIGLC